jgi:ComF family protein
MVNNFLQTCLNACFPQTCILCRLPSDRDLPLCCACESDLPTNRFRCSVCALPLPHTQCPVEHRVCGACQKRPPVFQRAVVPWIYDDNFALLIRRWKYQKQSHLTSLLAALWLQELQDCPRVDVLLPVPLHWRRRWQRGFNQSELLCAKILRARPELGVLEPGIAQRNRYTNYQSGMSAKERQGNLRDAFTVQEDCDNLRIAIVDDVLTTGATANALAGALQDAGASHIQIWCIARTPA